MKKLGIILGAVVIVLLVVFAGISPKQNQEFLRIHIRANSNSAIDQNVKYKIKDKVVETLIPFLSVCETKEESERIIKQNFPLIESIANEILEINGFSYKSKAKLTSEEFPTRTYGSLTLEQGVYDALILELGEAKGDNWWCVVYPPLCFTDASGKNVVYKSRILEIIKKALS